MGLRNVEFRLGEIEHLPVADGSVNVILSNCVINLSPKKQKVLREALKAKGFKRSLPDSAAPGGGWPYPMWRRQPICQISFTNRRP